MTAYAALKSRIDHGDIIFIAVPTPPQPDGSVDLSYIEAVARDIAGAMTEYKIVVDKSTVPVSTARLVHATIAKETTQPFSVALVTNPPCSVFTTSLWQP